MGMPKILLVTAMLFAGQVNAQTAVGLGVGGGDDALVSAAIRSSSDHMMELQLSNGVTFVIDDNLNKMFVDSGHGVQEMSLDAALLAWANGDSARAVALRAKFHAALNDPKREMTLTSDDFNVGNSLWGSDTTCFSADSSCGAEPELGTFSTSVSDFQASGWGSYSMTFAAFGTPEEEDEDDRREWERWRQEKCEDASNHAFNIAMAAIGAGATCPFSVTLVAGAGCFVAGSTLFWELDNWADDSVACNAPYPGPDRW